MYGIHILKCIAWYASMNKSCDSACLIYPTYLISVCPHTLASKCNRAVLQVDISSLNTAQRKAYDIVADHHTAQSASPLKMMVLGTAGTGKSFLILLPSTTITGQVPLNWNHWKCRFQHWWHYYSLCSTATNPAICKESGSSLASLQNRLKNTRYLIIDEVSMLGQRTLHG